MTVHTFWPAPIRALSPNLTAWKACWAAWATAEAVRSQLSNRSEGWRVALRHCGKAKPGKQSIGPHERPDGLLPRLRAGVAMAVSGSEGCHKLPDALLCSLFVLDMKLPRAA